MAAGNREEDEAEDRWPRPSGNLATPRSALHLQSFKQVRLCMHYFKLDKAQRLTDPMFTEDGDEAVTWDRPWCRPRRYAPQDHGCHAMQVLSE